MIKKLINCILIVYIFIYFVDSEEIKIQNNKINVQNQKSEQKFQETFQHKKNKLIYDNQRKQQLGEDFGSFKVFLQPNQKYVLTPALLFGSETSFKKQYRPELVDEKINYKSQDDLKQLFKIHPALQKLNSYNLTLVQKLNIFECTMVEVYFSIDNIAYIFCLQKQKVQVFHVGYEEIRLSFSFNLTITSLNQMNIISQTQVVFYNSSYMQYYEYDRVLKNVKLTEVKIKDKFLIDTCENYVQYSANSSQVSLYQFCYTNNNQLSLNKDFIKFQAQEYQQIVSKKDFVVLFLLKDDQIKLLDFFEIPQRNTSSLNHIIGLQVIDSLQKVIMMCYNVYNLTQNIIEDFQQIKQQSTYNNKKTKIYALNTSFICSYCSIFKIYIDTSHMILINRMQLQSTPFPLLETSLEVKVILAVATQVSITLYQVDIIKQMFNFIQKIKVPQKQFNCYEFSQLQNSIDSVSLTCAQNSKQFNTITFVMVFDDDLQKFMPVGDVFIGKRFFHTNQLIYIINQQELQIVQANQELITFSYCSQETVIQIYEIELDENSQPQNFASIIIYPAQQGEVYIDTPLTLITQIKYDTEDYIDLKNAFKGSNISFLRIKVVDQQNLNNSFGIDYQRNEFDIESLGQDSFIKQDRVYSYDYSLLVSLYIKQSCLRVIKYSDTQFYRILQIQKSRVDGFNTLNQTNNLNLNIKEKQQEEYYYYTQICSKYKNSYLCELSQINQPESLNQDSSNSDSLLFQKVSSKKAQKLLDLEYDYSQDAFIYLYSFKNRNQNDDTDNNYGLMFSRRQSDQNGIKNECYDLNPVFQLILNSIEVDVLTSAKIQNQIPFPQIKTIELDKKFIRITFDIGQIQFQTYCLIKTLKKVVFQNEIKGNVQNLKSFCISVFQDKSTKLNRKISSYIQESQLVILQSTKYLQSLKVKKIITVYRIYTQLYLKYQGQYTIVNSIQNANVGKQLQSQEQNDQDQFIGLYKQYIIIVNTTTISKYHMGIQIQLIYEFTFNPNFKNNQEDNHEDNHEDNQQQQQNEGAYKIKYVLFLEKYLIVQFQSFYQLYNIGEQLISIQIAANNFNAFIHSQNQRKSDEFQKYRLKHKNIQAFENVIINDAFLIEGDNILIYQRGHIVVAKYITNPKLQFGPFDTSHLIVQKDLNIRIIPVLDFGSNNQPISSSVKLQDNQKNIPTKISDENSVKQFKQSQAFQQIMIKIAYSHYKQLHQNLYSNKNFKVKY